jgi:hypothetical protein
MNSQPPSTGGAGHEDQEAANAQQRLNFFKQDASKAQLQNKFKAFQDHVRKDKRAQIVNRKRFADGALPSEANFTQSGISA